MSFTKKTKQHFNHLSDFILNNLRAGEEANINLHAEESTFVRLNNNKIRQNTHVEQKSISLLLLKEGKTAHYGFSISGHFEEDQKRAQHWLTEARQECEQLPMDPFQVAIKNNGTSETTHKGLLLSENEVFESLTGPAKGCDLAGLYSGGPLISANKNSQGQSHWFATESFFIDYSLFNGDRAVKGVYAGTEWNQNEYVTQIHRSENQLQLMNRPKKTLTPGSYRTYLAPGAVAELANMLSWEAISFGAYKKGTSALLKLANNEKSFSHILNIKENFQIGLIPRFNSLGELAPEKMELISEGKLKNFLISSRSAKEYSVLGNAADSWEGPRSLEITPGTLQESEILKELDTGLYLSNLHYLNWSDRMNARITGMTRYACFWVENGKIMAPISDMRFDESLYDCLGSNLCAITQFQEIDPQVSTYDSRSFGGKKIPGMLFKGFKLTL